MELTERLPEDLNERVQKLLAPEETVLLSVATDIVDERRYGDKWLVMTPQRLLVFSPNGDGTSHLSTEVPVKPIESARAENLVGNGSLEVRYDGPLNVVGPGAASPWQAVRLGGRIPVPVLAPFWEAATRTVEIAGAAIAPHVVECMRHGRTGSGTRAIEVLGLPGLMSTQEVLRELFEWAQVVPLATAREAVA